MVRDEPISDEALIQAIRNGDGTAAARLYHRHIDRVHRICYRIILNPSQVKDCVQEIWLKVFRNLDRYQNTKPFSAWLNVIAANTAIDFYRQAMRQKPQVELDEIPGEALATPEPTVYQQMEEDRTQRRIQTALQEISVTQRTACVLRYFEEKSIPEIAEVLQCREGTVRTHLRRSLLALREKLAAAATPQR